MRTDKFMMAKAWMKQDQAPQAEARDTWNTMEAEFNNERKTTLMASAESDEIIRTINDKFGPGTMKPASELPPIENPYKDFGDRNPAAYGGRMKFNDGLSALSFGKEQNIFKPKVLQRLLSNTGKKENLTSHNIVIKALKEAGIDYTYDVRQSSFDNVTKATINKFNKIATKLKADAGLPMSRYQAEAIKKEIKVFVKDKIKNSEYVSRPVILEHFGLGDKSGNALITRSLGVDEKAGTGLLKKLGQEEKVAQAAKNAAVGSEKTLKSADEVLKAINKEFIFNTDISSSEDIAKLIYGNDFPSGNMKTMSSENLKKAETLVRQTDNDVMTYLKVLDGSRVKPDGMKLPSQTVINDISDNILKGVEDESAPGQAFKKKGFRFSPGVLRQYKFSIVDNALKLKSGSYSAARDKLIKPNKNLDEVFSLSATADKAPGYATRVQSISKTANKAKMKQIDLPFQKILSALDGGKTTMQWNGKVGPIEDAIKDFNKTSSTFSKNNKVQTPKINYNEKLDEAMLESYGKESQKNIKEVYKNKNYFLSETNPKIETQDLKNLIRAVGCPNGTLEAASGGNCLTKGTELINNGMKGASKASMINGGKVLNALYKTGRNVMKFGIIPEAIFVAGESIIRSGGDQTLSEGFKSSIGFYTDWTGLTDFKSDARISQNLRNMGVADTVDLERLVTFDKSTNNLKRLKENQEKVLSVYDESLMGGVSEKEFKKQSDVNISKAESELKKNFLTETERVSFENKADTAVDIAGTRSPFKKALQAARNKTDNMRDGNILDLQNLSGMQSDMFSPEITQKNLNKKMLPQKQSNMYESNFMKIGQLPLGPRLPSEMDLLAERANKNPNRSNSEYAAQLKQYQNYLENERTMSLLNQEKIFGKEQTYGTQGNFFGEQIKPTPMYDYAEGGITGLRSKYEYKK